MAPTAAIVDVKTMAQIRAESVASQTFAMRLLIGFALAGILLALVGIYGALSLSVGSRKRRLPLAWRSARSDATSSVSSCPKA